VSKDKIRKTMFGMKNEKASGLVGFLAEIFKQT
jgi:hypothetical protein